MADLLHRKTFKKRLVAMVGLFFAVLVYLALPVPVGSQGEVLTAIPTATSGHVFIIDDFDYQNDEELAQYWNAKGTGIVEISVDADNTGTRALHMHTNLPCDWGFGRHALVTRRFTPALNLSSYTYIGVRVWSDVAAPAYGGEFSIALWDARGAREEQWQSTRWLDSTAEWITVGIHLSGNTADSLGRDPWNHPADFTVPIWLDDTIWPAGVVNGQLELTQIAGIGIRANTIDEDCYTVPASDAWIDSIFVR